VFLVLLVGELQGWTVRPWPPRLPTLVGQRSASVLGPTRGGIADVDYSPPFKVLGGHPHAPRHGGSAPLAPVCPPSWAKGPPAFWVPLVAGLLMWSTAPPFDFVGGRPHSPRHGGFAPLAPPFARFRGLRVCRRLGFHSWRGCQCGQIAPDFGFVGGTLPTMGLLTCLGLRNDVKRLTKVGLSW